MFYLKNFKIDFGATMTRGDNDNEKYGNYIFDLEVPLSDSIPLTWCALSRFHAPKDAELSLKRYYSAILSTRMRL